MALEKSDFPVISRFVRDTVLRLPPRDIKAVGIGRITGTPAADTPPTSDSSDRLATTAWVKAQGYSAGGAGAVSSVFGRTGAVVAASGDYAVGQVTGAAPLASPAFTGTPTAPTPATADNSTKIATTAYVQAQGYLTSAPVASVFGRTGAVVAASGDYTAAQVTNAADKSSVTIQSFTADVLAPNYYSDAVSTSFAAAGTLTPDVHTGEWFTASLTSAFTGTITIANATNPPNTSQTATIYVKIKNGNTTTAATVAWGTAYSFGTIAKPTSVAASSSKTIGFQWDPNSSLWQAVSQS